MRKGSSRASFLVGSSNYAYWKAHMKAFIMFIDDDAWEVVEKGWIGHIIIGTDGTISPKAKV